MGHAETNAVDGGDERGPSRETASEAYAARDAIAIVLAGVHAWGGNPVDRLGPRPMLPVVDRPLIAHTLGWLRRTGVSRASICANSGTRALRSGLGNGAAWGIELDYYEDVFPRGPAGCVRDAISGMRVPVCIVVEGTVIPSFDLEAMVEAHIASEAQVTLAAASPFREGESPDQPMVPLGVYLIAPAALEQIPPQGYQDIKEGLIPRLRALGHRVSAHMVPESSVLRVADPAAYLGACKSVLCRMTANGALPDGYRRVGEALVHNGADVDPSAHLTGPVLVGSGSVVEAGAMLIGPTCVGSGCRLGRRVILSRSVVWDGATIGDAAVVDQSVITSGVAVEAELVVRNSYYAPLPLRPASFWQRLNPVRPGESAARAVPADLESTPDVPPPGLPAIRRAGHRVTGGRPGTDQPYPALATARRAASR